MIGKQIKNPEKVETFDKQQFVRVWRTDKVYTKEQRYKSSG
jgi:hypothetical protein